MDKRHNAKRHTWTQEEYEFLRDNYMVIPYKEMAEILGLTIGVIKYNMRLLQAVDWDAEKIANMTTGKRGLIRPKKKRPVERNYTKEERKALRQYYLGRAHELYGL